MAARQHKAFASMITRTKDSYRVTLIFHGQKRAVIINRGLRISGTGFRFGFYNLGPAFFISGEASLAFSVKFFSNIAANSSALPS